MKNFKYVLNLNELGEKMKGNILFGGKAGQGPNFLSQVLGKALVKQGYYVFYSRDYQSLIRGGHNFNVLTFSDEPVYSNEKKLDILVALDENTEKIHKENLKPEGILLDGVHSNTYFLGLLFKILNFDFSLLEVELKEIGQKFEENLAEAKKGYNAAAISIQIPRVKSQKFRFLNGNQGISEGAIKSGLDVYYAYPMTPATTILSELAQKQEKNSFLTLELENEIAVINAGIGSAMTGAKSMVGTSGGGFDLMSESLSLIGIAEIPMVIALIQRTGPGTGVATYNTQGDLDIARHGGHGEFNRLVFAPGDPKEAEELTSQAFYFSQKYKVPVIILGDKHVGESFYTILGESEITSSKKSTELIRYNSYEKDEEGSATENPKRVIENINKRSEKMRDIEKEASGFKQYKIYGKSNSKNIVLSWGSTKGAIIDAIQGLDCRFMQIVYMEPFSKEIKKLLENKNIILIENNSTAQMGKLLAEKTGIIIDDENKVLRYDARPFLCDELKEEIKRRLK
ncbi:MAG: 2-oxoacid:acceptor oxidoreductase family protein [Candidatus Pacearchaeota archaeon]|nr:2-oxoacid:acceptor oxidoreductase family protein [Candidatus Pacearchaeota archaeon]